MDCREIMQRIKSIILIFYILQPFAEDKVDPSKLGDANLDTVSVKYYERNISEPVISVLYRRGPNLIYDCDNKHFACVNDESYKNCITTKQRYFEVFGNLCLKIKTYADQPKCFKDHQKFMDRDFMGVYCNKVKR